MASQPTATRRLPRKAAGALTLAIALIPNPAVSAAAMPGYCGTAAAGPGVDSNRSMERGALVRINEIRRKHGLHTLRADKHLRTAAMAHARDMIRRRYFAHNAPDGRLWSQPIQHSGYLVGHNGYTIGQNIAWGRYQCGSSRSIVHAWMNSPPHRRIILTARFRDVGIAVVGGAPVTVEGPAATYVADFGVRR